MNEESPYSLSTRISGALGFITGFVDACGFIALFGVSITYVADHSFLFSVPLVQSSLAMGTKFLAFPVFVAAIAATCFFMRALKQKPVFSFSILISVQITLIVAFSAAGLWALPFVNAHDPKTIVIGFAAAATMGVQSALSQLMASNIMRQNVITASVTQAMVDMSDLIIGMPAKLASMARSRFEHSWIKTVHFACGVTCGIVGYVVLSFWSLVVPIVMLLVIAILMRTRKLYRHPPRSR